MMKKNRKMIAVLLLLVLGLMGCAGAAADSGTLPDLDYLDMSNWAYYAIGEDKPVDVFLICPTVDTRDEYNMSLSDEKMKNHFVGALNMERGIYEDSARLFAPYYRQMSMKVYELPREEQQPYFDLAYQDVSAAFRWYLAHMNKGRPIILAGFSQGAMMCYRLLEDYFGEDVDLKSFDKSVAWGASLMDQLVSVYAIGWPCTQEMMDKYPQIRPAEGPDDPGTVISFDCEAPELTETYITPAGTKTYSINPLNWRTDSTPADKSENLGACFMSYDGSIKREEKGFCGCYLDPERGALKVTDIDSADYPAGIPVLPEGAYHIYDYQFFYRNLQENVKARVEAYLNELALADELALAA